MVNYTYECYSQIEIIAFSDNTKNHPSVQSANQRVMRQSKKMNKMSGHNRKIRKRGHLKQPGGSSCNQRR